MPSVRRTTSSVFKTAAGADWIALLEALEQPQRTRLLRRLALTPFVGWTVTDLESRDLDALGVRLRRWVHVFNERGIAALLETVSRDERMPTRLLGQIDGERRLTDIRHVGEALHSAGTTGQLGLAAMIEWLRRRVRESHRDTTVERSRRLDSDAAAVQIVTVWASKGLEFPVVLVPFEWDRYLRDDAVPLFHADDGQRVRDVGGSRGARFSDSRRRARSELLGEHLRLLYVAMTRAQAQVTAWWAPSKHTSDCAPLHRLLFADNPAAGVDERAPVPGMEHAATVLTGRAVGGVLAVTPVDPVPPPRWRGEPQPQSALAAAVLGRDVDSVWRRTSYSALTRSVHDANPVIGSEPEIQEKDDEPETAPPVGADAHPLLTVPSPMADLPGGTSFGTLVHAVLEYVDTTTGDLATEVREHVDVQLARSGTMDVAADDLVSGLLPSLHTPLGPLADGRSLAEITPADRLSELDFELPLCGGDVPNGTTVLRDIAALLRTHVPPDDPLAAYADMLAEPAVGDSVLRGYLGGSIDAVLRIGDRYVVADYKTNRLGEPDIPLTAWDYRVDAMAEAMLHAHYPLQALLYTVALHRFLRWRLSDYDPERHLGGTLYLFLRGMCGPGVQDADGSIPGVFAWRPSTALVLAVSDALATGVTV